LQKLTYLAYPVSSVHLLIDIQREVTNTIIWGYNDRRDQNPSHIQRWIPITAEQDPPLLLNEVIQQILLPASFARGYREQQRRYSAPVRRHPPAAPAQPLARTRSLSLHSNSTDQSYQTAPDNISNVQHLQDESLDTPPETLLNFTTTPLTLKGVLKQKVRIFGLSIKAQIAGAIGDFTRKQSRQIKRRTL
jgi:hypothetical protein